MRSEANLSTPAGLSWSSHGRVVIFYDHRCHTPLQASCIVDNCIVIVCRYRAVSCNYYAPGARVTVTSQPRQPRPKPLST